MQRCLESSVGAAIPIESMVVDASTLTESERTYDAPSYPGLTTRERRYTVVARVPSAAVSTQPGFTTDELSADGGHVLYR